MSVLSKLTKTVFGGGLDNPDLGVGKPDFVVLMKLDVLPPLFLSIFSYFHKD